MARAGGAPKMYGELAGWFHLVTAPHEYVQEAEAYRAVLAEVCAPGASVLELGAGGGNNASHLKAHFEMTLTDISEDMLALSRSVNLECEHLTGDMRTLRLGREFDAVFVHDAICYMTTVDELRAVIQTAAVHCRRGGMVLLAPDFISETFRSYTDHGGNDGDGRSLRYLEWVWDPDPTDGTYLGDYAYLLREGDDCRAVFDRHVCGLFDRGTWLQLMDVAGLDATARPLDLGDGDAVEAFAGIKR